MSKKRKTQTNRTRTKTTVSGVKIPNEYSTRLPKVTVDVVSNAFEYQVFGAFSLSLALFLRSSELSKVDCSEARPRESFVCSDSQPG